MATPSPRRTLLLLLLFVHGAKGVVSEPISGITRLQKLLFLAKQETNVEKLIGSGYEFEAYRFGPYSAELYDDIDFLENLRLLTTGPGDEMPRHVQRGKVQVPDILKLSHRKEASAADVAEARKGLDYLLEEDAEARAGDEYAIRIYRLTPKGEKLADLILNSYDPNRAKEIYASLSRIKTTYGSLPLRDLLRHVYGRYEEWTKESEIKDLF